MRNLAASFGRLALRREIGPFAAVFAPSRSDPVPYPSLLNLVDDDRSTATLRVVQRANSRRGAERHRVDLLRASDWRVQLVGAAVTLMSPSASLVTAAWSAIDSGSWVTPQIAAVLSRADPKFLHAAIERLSNGCRAESSTLLAMDNPIARHVAQGPGGVDDRAAKTASSLAALLMLDHPSDPTVAELSGALTSSRSSRAIAMTAEESQRHGASGSNTYCLRAELIRSLVVPTSAVSGASLARVWRFRHLQGFRQTRDFGGVQDHPPTGSARCAGQGLERHRSADERRVERFD